LELELDVSTLSICGLCCPRVDCKNFVDTKAVHAVKGVNYGRIH